MIETGDSDIVCQNQSRFGWNRSGMRQSFAEEGTRTLSTRALDNNKLTIL